MRKEARKQCYYKKKILDIIMKQLNLIAHASLSWITCYDDLCYTYLEEKNEVNWFSRKLKLAI